MPSTEKNEKSKLTGMVDSFLDKKASKRNKDGSPDFLSIIEFIERFKLLPYGLFPSQKFILKLYYGLPLDDITKVIKVKEPFSDKLLYEFTEVEYLRYLYDQGRCNIREQDSKLRYELVLVLGRRSGKSTLAALISAYELYKLLRRGCPQEHYGISTVNEIRVLCIANDKEQASIVYGEMSGYINQVDYFKSSITHDTQTYMKFQTDYDKKKYGEGMGKRASIISTFKSSIAKGLRGRGTICVILDELAFFVDDGKSSAQRVYKAITPGIGQFSPKDPNNKHVPLGPPEGRIIAISSPDAREGFFYNLYQQSLTKDKASSNMLMIQAPTWEINPTLSSEYYSVEYAKDPKSFDTEHGGSFSDRVRGWIENQADLTDCIGDGLKPILRGLPREPYFAGVDFGIVKDGTSIVLSHIRNGKIEVAYHETWYAGKSWKEVNPHLDSPLIPYAMELQNSKRIDIDEIINWFVALSRRFFILKGVFDQWAGPIFEQKLHKSGLSQIEMKNFSVNDSSQIYQMAKMLMYARQLSIYDFPLPDSTLLDVKGKLHSPMIQELLELQSRSGGKNITIVEAPNIAGKHDDVSDALVRSLSLAIEYTRLNPRSLESAIINHVSQRESPAMIGYHQFHRVRARMHGPPPRERRVPFLSKRGN